MYAAVIGHRQEKLTKPPLATILAGNCDLTLE